MIGARVFGLTPLQFVIVVALLVLVLAGIWFGSVADDQRKERARLEAWSDVLHERDEWTTAEERRVRVAAREVDADRAALAKEWTAVRRLREVDRRRSERADEADRRGSLADRVVR